MRIKQTPIAAKLIATILGEGTRCSSPEEPVPDLKIVEVKFSPELQTLTVYLESETFDDVPQGAPIPQWLPAFRRWQCSCDSP